MFGIVNMLVLSQAVLNYTDRKDGGHYMESLCLNEVPTYKDQLLNNQDNIMEQK